MSTVTTKLNLTKPEGIEQYSLPLLNANFDKLDGAMPVFTTANSTFNASLADFTNSRFIRLSVGTTGIIIANILAVFANGYTVTVPANGASPVYFNAAIVPTNMRSKNQVGLVTGPLFSNENRGDNMQGLLALDGRIGIRSQGAEFTRGSLGQLWFRWQIAYEWDGTE